MSEQKNLWGDIAMPVTSGAEYVTLMLEQGTLLKSQTNDILSGEVSQTIGLNNVYMYYFNIVAPELADFRYALFKTVGGFYTYPIFIFDHGQCSELTWSHAGLGHDMPNVIYTETLAVTPSKTMFFMPPTYRADNFEQFEQSLATILQSDSTKKVIEALLVKSQSVFT